MAPRSLADSVHQSFISMEKWIKKIWVAEFFLPAINATVFSMYISIVCFFTFHIFFQNSKYTVGILLNVKTTLMISKKENGLLLKNNQNPRVRIPEAPNLIKITVILRVNFQMTEETDTNGLIGDLELILIETLDGETTIEIGQINKMVLILKYFTSNQIVDTFQVIWKGHYTNKSLAYFDSFAINEFHNEQSFHLNPSYLL